MKKSIAIILLLVMFTSVFCLDVSAFGGYAHWKMGAQIMERSTFDDKTDDVKLAYISGCVLADIGEAGWDSEKLISDGSKVDSDRYLVTNKIYEVSRSLNARSRAMAYGWRDHYIQDMRGSVKNIDSPHTKYRLICGWIDEYLRDKEKAMYYPIRSGDTGSIYIYIYTYQENI